MSGKKIDLAEIERDVRLMHDDEVLALVAAVRAARAYIGSGHVADRMALDAALAPFTDSAEVRSDGE